MKRYFFTVEFLLTDSDPELLSGRCISILHGFLKAHHLAGIGVCFPRWSNSTIGRVIGFVSTSREHLLSFRSQPYFENMSLGDFFSLSEVLAVPDDVGEVRFVRNQGIKKCFVGEKRRRLARAKLRAEERGEVFDPTQLSFERELEHFHRAVMDSQSTGERFVLHIQKQQVEGVLSFEFNHYGLATNEGWRGTVPELMGVVGT
tara:strand:- start:777 stop:1385 length:609 start_codon:yes stop_codon:yes gene_type:complete